MRAVKWGLVLALALVPLFARQVRAQSDHKLLWHTIETPHFRIHYHEPLGLLAREIAAEADEINRRVEHSLGLKLRQRVELVLKDHTDDANGAARVLPYNAIELRAAAPEDMSPLSDYEHWSRLLLTHEHTHILHLEASGGVPWLLQQLFGRFYTPQSYLPGWFKEGLAVVQESEHTSGGRARSTIFEMYMRMDALEDRLLGLDWIGFEGEPWPHGQVRYLYGQAFVGFIARRHGHAALGRFATEYGKRIVPYGMNRALKRATGETFTTQYRLFLDELRARSRAKQQEIEAAGRVEGTRITFHGELTRSPRFLSDDQVAYAVADARNVPEVRRLSLHDGRVQRIARVGNVGQVAAVPRSTRLVYSQSDYHRGIYFYDELFAVDHDGGDRRKLTSAARAREPDVSADGRRIAFVTQAGGTGHLEIAELADVESTRRRVVASRRLDQVFTPRWSPDGRTIAYSALERGGYRDLFLLDVASGARTRLTYDRAIDRGPVFSRDGRTLYFSSDRSGIANLYAYELATGAVSQITNVVGGAFQPDVSPDGKRLVYLGYSSRGFDLFLLELERMKPRPAHVSYERPAPRPLPTAAAVPSTSYQPLRTLWPRYFQLGYDSAALGTRLVVNTSGADAVGQHSWSLRAYTNVERPDRAIELAYANRIARFPLLVYGDLREGERQPRGSDLVVNRRGQSWHARESSLGMASSIRFPRPLYSVSFRGDYVGSFLQKARPFDVPLDPNYPPPTLPPLGYDARVHLSGSFSSVQRQPFDISASWGQSLSVGCTVHHPYLGSREPYFGCSYRAEQFVRMHFRESVLALAYTGAHRTYRTLGGFAAQLVPLGDALLGTLAVPGDYARLRGFPLRGGEQLAVAQLEYRVLVSRINRGIETLPIFARRVHAALFVDAGDAWTGDFALRRVGVGIGGELRFSWSSDYGVDYTLRLGIAQGVTRFGELQWYTSLATPF